MKSKGIKWAGYLLMGQKRNAYSLAAKLERKQTVMSTTLKPILQKQDGTGFLCL
jgi:hypothetical protein